MPLTTSAFDLPDRLAAKADPALIADDERHFAAVAASLQQSIDELSDRLATERRAPGGTGQEALDRDLEIHRLSARLRALRRFGLDLCLGRIVAADGAEPVYVGRLGLTDSDGRRLLVGADQGGIGLGGQGVGEGERAGGQRFHGISSDLRWATIEPKFRPHEA